MEARIKRKLSSAMVTALAGVGLLQAAPASAEAATASAELKAGSLAFVSTPPNVTFPNTTLNGQLQTLSAEQPIEVGDATGSGSGWNITATSTTFTTGSHTLSTSATTIASAPLVACGALATGCVTATTTVSYPYSLPAGSTAPTATKMFNASANTGMGNQVVTPTWKLAIPPSTYAGTYTSTWTISLVSGP
jgi:WxL domain surface cell wall-binding